MLILLLVAGCARPPGPGTPLPGPQVRQSSTSRNTAQSTSERSGATASANRARTLGTATATPTVVDTAATTTVIVQSASNAVAPGRVDDWGRMHELPIGAWREGTYRPPEPFLTMGRPFTVENDVPFSATYPYGSDGGGWLLLHHGLDFGSAPGTTVTSLGAGLVEFAGADDGPRFGPQLDFYGQLVVVRHEEQIDDRSLYSLYGHLMAVDVVRGQRVGPGAVLGRVGGTGIALGPHLHLETRLRGGDYGSTLNPALLMAPRNEAGAIAGRLLDAAGDMAPGVVVALFRLDDDGATSWVAETSTYLDGPINHVPGLYENLIFADVPAGRYRLERQGDGPRASGTVDVVPGQLSVVTLRYGQGLP